MQWLDLKNMDQDFIMHFSITRIDDGLAKGKEVILLVKVDLDPQNAQKYSWGLFKNFITSYSVKNKSGS